MPSHTTGWRKGRESRAVSTVSSTGVTRNTGRRCCAARWRRQKTGRRTVSLLLFWFWVLYWKRFRYFSLGCIRDSTRPFRILETSLEPFQRVYLFFRYLYNGYLFYWNEVPRYTLEDKAVGWLRYWNATEAAALVVVEVAVSPLDYKK